MVRNNPLFQTDRIRIVSIMIIKRILIIAALVCFPLSAAAGMQPPEDFNTFTIYVENDSFSNTDRDYTNGVKITWSTSFQFDPRKVHLPRWSYPIINRLPFINNTSNPRAVSFSLGQNIYTPENIGQQSLIEDDRPYAGYLYFGLGFHSRTLRRKDSWEFEFGIVGPHAYAEQAQNNVHRLIGVNPANGWDNQLKDEPAFQAVYESQWRWLASKYGQKFGYDIIPHLGAHLGNVQIFANGGAEFRVGWHLGRNFGTCPIRAGCEVNSACSLSPDNPARPWRRKGIHLFFSVDGRMMLRDIFLDGNTFRDSHSVDKKTFVADFMGGIGVTLGRLKATYAYVYRTRQFYQRDQGHVFGALTLSFSY